MHGTLGGHIRGQIERVDPRIGSSIEEIESERRTRAWDRSWTGYIASIQGEDMRSRRVGRERWRHVSSRWQRPRCPWFRKGEFRWTDRVDRCEAYHEVLHRGDLWTRSLVHFHRHFGRGDRYY